MELCTTQVPLDMVPSVDRRLSPSITARIGLRTSLSLKTTTSSLPKSGKFTPRSTLLRASWSGDKSPEANKFGGESSDSVTTVDSSPSVEKKSINDCAQPVAVKDESQLSNEESSADDEQDQPFAGILDNFDLQLDSEDSYSIFLYAAGAVVAIWLLSAVVSAINAIPVLPKVLEVVGLGYSVWFTTRYLIFKKNRKELASKIDELKREVLGPGDD